MTIKDILLALIMTLLGIAVIFCTVPPAHACEVTPGDWEAIQEEIVDNGK